MSYFWNGYVLHNFLFKGLDTESIPGLVGVCVGIFSVALLYEGLRSLKSILIQKYSENGRESPVKGSKVCRLGLGATNVGEQLLNSGNGAAENTNGEPLVQNDNDSNERSSPKRGIVDKIANLSMASSFHAAYVFLGFSLMNAVMTFNIYIFISAIFGIGLGYFFFYDCSRLKLPYLVAKSDVAQCQSLLPPDDVRDENGGPNSGIHNSATRYVQRGHSNDNELVVQAEIYNVPSVV